MTNLHELTKQLDVLTWNSRSVLNALIRSAMAAGSSKGFTVKRAGDPVSLDRQDIYRIYHFYETWAEAGYPSDTDTFNQILAEENACYGDGTPVTDALVKHAKMLWMDATNKDSSIDDWLHRIYSVENPKWLTNTAPIPLNIRTPIYDENLSTKTYDSYETYLFPSAYYSMDVLGYNGDGIDHTAGGKNWTFDVNELVRISADRVVFGTQNATFADRVSHMYGNYSPKSIFEGGTNSFAFKQDAFSFGDLNYVNANYGAALGGQNNMVLGAYGGVFAGEANTVAQMRGAVAGGIGNTIGSCTNGFAANSFNQLGGYNYVFSRKVIVSNTETTQECPTQKNDDEHPDCVYVLQRSESATVPTQQGTSLSSGQIFIDHNDITPARLNTHNNISYGSDATWSPFDFKINDMVVIHSVRDSNGIVKPCSPITAKVVNIEKLTSEGIQPMTSDKSMTGYVVSLDIDFTAKTWTDLGSGVITGGYICRETSSNYPHYSSKDGKYYVKDYYDAKNVDGAAVGYNNIVAGRSQFVAGASNEELIRPLFMVGSGFDGVHAGDAYRQNAFVSSRDYTYSMTSKYIVSGVSDVTTAYIHGDADWEYNQKYDEDFYICGVRKYRGFYAYSMPDKDDDDRTAVLRVFNEKSVFAIGWTGLVIYEPYTSNKTVWEELRSDYGGIGIHSGSFLEDGQQDSDNNWLAFYNNNVRMSTTSGKDNTITVWAKDKVGIHGRQTLIHASTTSGYIDLEACGLRINADTRECLTAQPIEGSVNTFTMQADRIDHIKDTGHVFTFKSASGFTANHPYMGSLIQNSYFKAFHVFTSSHMSTYNTSTGSGIYDVAQLLIPGHLDGNCVSSLLRGTGKLPHPMIISQKVMSTQGGTSGMAMSEAATPLGGDGLGYIYEELAYRSDLDAVTGTKVVTNLPSCCYDADDSIYSKVDDSNPDVPGYTKALIQDPFLKYIDSSDNSCHGGMRAVDEKDLSSNNACVHKIVRAKSIANNAGKLVNTTNSPAVLDGVALNPCFVMTGTYSKTVDQVVIDDDNINAVQCYLAYGPQSLRSSDVTQVGETIISTNYTTNLATNSTDIKRTLATSKFSYGSTSTPNDLCDIWATVLISATDGGVRWIPLLIDFNVVISGGMLTVDFKLNVPLLQHYVGLPTKQYSTPGNIMTFDDTFDYTSRLIYSPSMTLLIPLLPSVFNNVTFAYNPGTSVISYLYGRAHFTGNANVFATGLIIHEAAAFGYKKNEYPPASFTMHAPMLQLAIAGVKQFGENGFNSLMQFHLEGPIQYAN